MWGWGCRVLATGLQAMGVKKVRVDSGTGKRSKTRSHTAGSCRAARRSAMGEYIPAPGARPLSSRFLPSPSAMDYSPSTKLTHPRFPQYTIQSRPYPLKSPPMPGPADYDTSRNTEWQDKTFSLREKDVTWPYDTRKDAHVTCGPGAGHYHRTYEDTGQGVKRSMSGRHREGIHAGYPNLLVQPVDTHGFATPSPSYRPASVRGQEHYCGTTLRKEGGETISPGPAAYTLPTPVPPSPYFGKRLSVDWDPHYPAPNVYDVPGLVGSGPAKSFGTKVEGGKVMASPGPQRYFLRSTRSPVAHSITYRTFPTPPEKRPGSAEYLPTFADLSRTPQYSCRRQCLPTFPDILNFPEHAPLQTPSAAQYECDRGFWNNSNPAYSIGLPLPLKPNTHPAPNKYSLHYDTCSNFHSSPRYSMGQQFPPCGKGERSRSPSPSPAAYHPRPTSSNSVSITPRRSRERVSPNPAPNCYSVERGQTHRGQFTGPAASMKGRPTPALYSGFPSSHMARLQSLST